MPDDRRKDPNAEAKETVLRLAILPALLWMALPASCFGSFLEELARNPTWGLWAVVRFFRSLFGL
jgi:hypothetical protein